MRKIEKAMCEAIKAHKYWKSGNTEVNVRKDMYGFEHIEVCLHGNMIWRWSEAEDMAEFTLAGWNTVTTKSRLHALGVDVSGGVTPKLNGIAIDSNKWYEIRKRVYVFSDN